ncbi:MAG: HEAT repeat domain-containing protein [Byssovorax sp.]
MPPWLPPEHDGSYAATADDAPTADGLPDDMPEPPPVPEEGSGETIPRVVARLAESVPEPAPDHALRFTAGARPTRPGLAGLDFSGSEVEPRDDGDRPSPLIPADEQLTVPLRDRPTMREVPYAKESLGGADVDSPTRPVDRSGGKRAQAPVYLGRSKTPAVRSGLEPLPHTPPPNAKAWTTFPSPPPPPPHAPPGRGRSDRPIPREEDDAPFGGSPAASSVTGGALLAAAVEPGRPSPVPHAAGDLGTEHGALLQRLIEGGPGSQEAFKELVRNGEHLLPALMSRFPGPLRIDRHRTRGELPAASQCGAILELIVAIRRPALPFVTVRLSSHDPEVRFWATHVLGELRYPEAANVLVPRIFDDDPAVRRVARRSAASLVNAGAAGAPILQGLDNITRSADQPRSQRLIAIEAMGEIRAPAMVPALIAVLNDPSDEVADAARRALLLITRQDFGKDARRFKEWWTKNAGRHRIEWLIDALMHEQPSIRRAAGDELKLITKEYFGYYDDLPKRERERAQALYRAWWEREGQARFS